MKLTPDVKEEIRLCGPNQAYTGFPRYSRGMCSKIHIPFMLAEFFDNFLIKNWEEREI